MGVDGVLGNVGIDARGGGRWEMGGFGKVIDVG